MPKPGAENEHSEKSLTSVDILKILGALGFIIPLVLGYFQYRQDVQENYAENFREVVSKLSSDKSSDRIASATNLGTYISKGRGEAYYQEAINILVNAVSNELDVNVLNAIRGSLENTDIEDYKEVIKKLLAIDRNIFYYKTAYIPDSVKDKLERHQDLASRFTSLFLEITKNYEIEDLTFNQNAWLNTNLTDIKLKKAFFKNSALSGCAIIDTEFDNTSIIHTAFLDSDLGGSKFINSEITSSYFCRINNFKDVKFTGTRFNDVYFAGSDLEGADFRGSFGLKPAYFYKAKNISKAIFDTEFKNELKKTALKSDSDFLNFIEKSSLTSMRREELVRYGGIAAETDDVDVYSYSE